MSENEFWVLKEFIKFGSEFSSNPKDHASLSPLMRIPIQGDDDTALHLIDYKEYENLKAMADKLASALEDGLKNMSCDFYTNIMCKPEIKDDTSTGIAQKVHNQDIINRFNNALLKQKQVLDEYRKMFGGESATE